MPAETVITLANLLSVVFSGVTLIVVVTMSWKGGAWAATVSLRLDMLKDLPAKVGALEQRVGVVEKDVHNLWQSFRDYMAQNEAEENKYLKFLKDWDQRHETNLSEQIAPK